MTTLHRQIAALITASVFSASPLVIAQQAGYETPRTEYGAPDFQGIWTNRAITRLERRPGVEGLVLSEERAYELAQGSLWMSLDRDQQNNPITDAEVGEAAFGTRGHNAFWIDAGFGMGVVKGEYRSSWITDPADGRIPYKEGGAALRRASHLPKIGSFDGPETRPVGERCIALANAIGPVMMNGIYNNNYQFVQTKDHVMFRAEMGHEVRIIPLADEHNNEDMQPWFGDSIARYEGDTLVVETIKPYPLQGSYISLTGKVTERFTRWSDNEIFYEFRVEDPTIYTQPWGGELSFYKETAVFEYACHEGNYSLPGILAGARRQELDEQ
ncbi:MAG TPA: hypothetical protein DCM64_04655 [Gammaproteobacteria bacterium]|jgi:hypothetical protein|nr:hypothetical protein [Gammaproteobacteria bacterium]MDP6733241.1 hypothetical protein [Gammaproteobacteria bacterium]HAJ75727.1 hypothetical protein [Gammaproteobacteria bacterium]